MTSCSGFPQNIAPALSDILLLSLSSPATHHFRFLLQEGRYKAALEAEAEKTVRQQVQQQTAIIVEDGPGSPSGPPGPPLARNSVLAPLSEASWPEDTDDAFPLSQSVVLGTARSVESADGQLALPTMRRGGSRSFVLQPPGAIQDSAEAPPTPANLPVLKRCAIALRGGAKCAVPRTVPHAPRTARKRRRALPLCAPVARQPRW